MSSDSPPYLTQAQYNDIIRDYQKLMVEMTSNTQMTRDIHGILVGQPQFKRKGLVEIVDWHQTLLTKGGGIVLAMGLLYGVLRAFGVLH